jgi:glycosyltransferase involved in cell wall biosynthesis
MVKQLSRSHEVTLVSLVHNSADRRNLNEISDYCKGVFPVAANRQESLKSCAKRLLSRVPLQAASAHLPSFTRIVNGLIRKGEFDIVHVEHIQGVHFADHIDELPKVYDSVDCVTQILQQYLATTRNPFTWFLTLEEWAKMRVYEGVMSQRFDKVITSTDDSKEALERLIWPRVEKKLKAAASNGANGSGRDIEEWRRTRCLIEIAQNQRLEKLRKDGERVSVIPNGVDTGYFAPQDGVTVEPELLVFAGNMSSLVNIQAVHYFYDNILPVIRAGRPDVRFKIVGNDPAVSIRKLGKQPDVEVTGYVDDIRPHVAGASVVVSPVTAITSGMLESMAMGKAVVTMAKAFSNVDVEDTKAALTAVGPDEYAGKVLHLLEDQSLRRTVEKNAVRFVKENYSWHALVRRLEDVYEEARVVFCHGKLAGASSGGW